MNFNPRAPYRQMAVGRTSMLTAIAFASNPGLFALPKFEGKLWLYIVGNFLLHRSRPSLAAVMASEITRCRHPSQEGV